MWVLVLYNITEVFDRLHLLNRELYRQLFLTQGLFLKNNRFKALEILL
jgi:hypothetical protein